MDEVIRKPRIAISSEALQIIKIWATLENKTADEKLSELVISSAPPKVKELIISKPLKVEKAEVTGYKISEPAKMKKAEVVEYKTESPKVKKPKELKIPEKLGVPKVKRT